MAEAGSPSGRAPGDSWRAATDTTTAAAASQRTAAGDLVIGIGNPLRGDDGVGCWLAQRAERLRPAPRVLAVQQLTPELSEALTATRRVLFVDAWLPPDQAGRADRPRGPAAEQAGTLPGASAEPPQQRRLQPRLQRLRPPAAALDPGANQGHVFSHGFDPAQLLAITALLQGRAPAGWQLLVPAFDLRHGDGLSPQLRCLLPQAEALLIRWCQDPEAAALSTDAAAEHTTRAGAEPSCGHA